MSSTTMPLPIESPLRDGSSPMRAVVSRGLLNNPDEKFTYYIYLIGDPNKWHLVNADEARRYHVLDYAVYTSWDGHRVTEFVDPVPPTDREGAFHCQFAEIDAIRDSIERDPDEQNTQR